MPKVVRGRRRGRRRRLHHRGVCDRKGHRLGSGDVRAVAHLEPLHEADIRLHQMTRVTNPGRSRKRHRARRRVPGRNGDRRHTLRGLDGARQGAGRRGCDGGVNRSTAGSPAGFRRTLTTSKDDAVMMSPTLTWSKRAAERGTSSVTMFPISPRTLTVRAAWSTASTVPRRVISLRNLERGCALATADERARDTRTKSKHWLFFNIASLHQHHPPSQWRVNEPRSADWLSQSQVIKRQGQRPIVQNVGQLGGGRGHSSSKKQIRDFAEISIVSRLIASREQRTHDRPEDRRRLVVTRPWFRHAASDGFS